MQSYTTLIQIREFTIVVSKSSVLSAAKVEAGTVWHNVLKKSHPAVGSSRCAENTLSEFIAIHGFRYKRGRGLVGPSCSKRSNVPLHRHNSFDFGTSLRKSSLWYLPCLDDPFVAWCSVPIDRMRVCARDTISKPSKDRFWSGWYWDKRNLIVCGHYSGMMELPARRHHPDKALLLNNGANIVDSRASQSWLLTVEFRSIVNSIDSERMETLKMIGTHDIVVNPTGRVKRNHNSSRPKVNIIDPS